MNPNVMTSLSAPRRHPADAATRENAELEKQEREEAWLSAPMAEHGPVNLHTPAAPHSHAIRNGGSGARVGQPSADAQASAVAAADAPHTAGGGDKGGTKLTAPRGTPDNFNEAGEVPVFVFVNMKSGGLKGRTVFAEFQQLLPKEHVVSLQDEGGPEGGLQRCLQMPTLIFRGNPEKARIVVAGGDGTVGWVVNGMDHLQLHEKQLVPVMHLPLGTGNDMARATGWGAAFDGGVTEARQILQRVRSATAMQLDRWLLRITSRDGAELVGGRNGLKFYNYVSLGLDAAVALKFHEMRERRPTWFKNRTLNKFWYVVSGALTITDRHRALHRVTKLLVDDEHVPLPPSSKTLILLNIQSYMAGADLWGTKMGYSPRLCCMTAPSSLAPGSMGDGRLDLLGVSSVPRQAMFKAFKCSGKRIVQGRKIMIEGDEAMPVQVDGEPWMIEGGFRLTIDPVEAATMLVGSTKC